MISFSYISFDVKHPVEKAAKHSPLTLPELPVIVLFFIFSTGQQVKHQKFQINYEFQTIYGEKNYMIS